MRKFGVELEVIGPVEARGNPLGFARDIMTRAGVDASTSRSHLGNEYDRWQAKPDGSVSPADRMAEVVSRIMPASESSYDEVTRVVTALETAGYGVNRTCGFHVHISVADLPVTTRQLIILRYASLQAQISAMMPPSRRASNWAQVVSPSMQATLILAIERGREEYPTIGKYCVTNMNYITTRSGNGARIEFRQAGGTCNAAKVVGWVRFLQEMIDEVARRAAGVRFLAAPAPGIPIRPVTSIATPSPLSRVPRMRPGSDTARACEQLMTRGAVSASWASENGIGENVLRRIIVGFRRHGADLNTLRTDNGPVYTLAGTRSLPLTQEQVFAAPVATATVPPVAAPAPVPTPIVPARQQVAPFVAYPLDAGLSVATMAWVRDRRDTFNADADQSAVA